MTLDERINELDQLYLKQSIIALSPKCPHCLQKLGMKAITIWTDDKVKQYKKEIKKLILEGIKNLPNHYDDSELFETKRTSDLEDLLEEE